MLQKKNLWQLKHMVHALLIILCVFFYVLFLNISTSLAEETAETQLRSTDNSTLQDHVFQQKDLYMRAYDFLDEFGDSEFTLRKKAYSVVANSMGLSERMLSGMLLENAADMEKVCTLNDPAKCAQSLLKEYCWANNEIYKLTDCQKKLRNRISGEYSRAAFQENLHEYALSSQAFANGTLQDTGGGSFDIIVDLNIIDLLIFGDKMNVPQTGSPFLPSNPFDENSDSNDADADDSEMGSFEEGSSGDSSQNESNSDETEEESDEAGDSETENAEENENESDEGFCVDHSIIFSSSITSQILGGINNEDSVVTTENTENNNSDQNGDSDDSSYETSNSEYAAMQMGDIIPDPQIKYTGGVYPDLSSFGSSGGCEAGEKSYFSGRLCIPEFCTDLICIKIKLKTGYRKLSLRNLDCVECHIDRANEAIAPFIGTKGANTPTSNSMESYFMSSFANLFKDVTTSITLKPKRLPFLVYDESLSQQAKQKELEKQKAIEKAKEEEAGADSATESGNSEDLAYSSTGSEETLEAKNAFLAQNEELYDSLLTSKCSEVYQNFLPGEGILSKQFDYCNTVSAQKVALAQEAQRTLSLGTLSLQEKEKQSQGRSETFHNVVQPFFWQMSMDMVSVNDHLDDVSIENIRKKAQSCVQKAQ